MPKQARVLKGSNKQNQKLSLDGASPDSKRALSGCKTTSVANCDEASRILAIHGEEYVNLEF